MSDEAQKGAQRRSGSEGPAPPHQKTRSATKPNQMPQEESTTKQQPPPHQASAPSATENPPNARPSWWDSAAGTGLTVDDAKKALAALRDEATATSPSSSPPATASLQSPDSFPEFVDDCEMIANNESKFRKFRDPHKDPLEIAVQYKVMALSKVSNEDQTFTMTIMEDVAIRLTRREFDEYVHCTDRTQFRPFHFLHTYVYNSSGSDWQEPNRTVEGCAFHIRDVFDDQRCWAFRQRQGKITFNQPFDLRNFPFDVQDLTCRFALYTYTNLQDAQRLKVVPMYGGATFSAKFVEPNDEYRVYRDHRSFEESGGYIFCTYKIGREWQYYLWRVVVVLAMVTLTALAALVNFESYMDQMAHLSTVLLTDVAYLYTIQEHMPRLRYFTLLDWCVFGNIMFVFCIFLQITILEVAEVDVNAIGSYGYNLRDKFLFANLAGWAACGTGFTMFCFRAWYKELKKLGKPHCDSDLYEQDHKTFPINMSFHKKGQPMNCLLLRPRKQDVLPNESAHLMDEGHEGAMAR